MTHKFDIKSLTLLKPVEKSRKFYLLVKVSEKYWFRTAYHHINNLNIIPFMEINEFNVPEDLMIYYSVSLYEKFENGSKLLQKKLLFKRDIKKEEMTFKFEDDNAAVLSFKAIVTNNAANLTLTLLDKRIADSAAKLAEVKDASRLELLELGVLTYKFVNRLDPLVYIGNYLREVIHWKNPLHTLFFGSCCTFFILNPQLAIILSAALIVYHKDTIFMKLENFSRSNKDRLIPTDQNLKFLRNAMEFYNSSVDHIKEVIFGEDKTEFIVFLNAVISTCWVFMVLPAFVNFSTMLVFGLWFGLLIGLDMSKIVLDFLRTLHRRPLEYLAVKLEREGWMSNPLIQKIILLINTYFPGVIEMPVRKTFYVYEYQRWWMGNWGEPYKHESKWSDAKGVVNVLPRAHPPSNYKWICEWEIQINPNETDEEGFMYSSDFMTSFHKSYGVLDVLKRRMWTKTCVRITIQQLSGAKSIAK